MNPPLTLAGLLATSFVVALSGALMPGPLLAVTIAESAKRGHSAGPLLVLGHAILEFCFVAVVLLCGLAGAGFIGHPMVVRVAGLAGGIMLGWMGLGMLRSSRRTALDCTAAAKTTMHPVVAGIVVSLLNPYWIFWWATIGISYLVIGIQFGAAGVAAFFVGHIMADLTWYWLVSAAAAKGRRILPDAVYRKIIACCGCLLVVFGAWFLWTGISGADLSTPKSDTSSNRAI